MELPTGTVTFLYTDIEGSTRRWEAHPDAMKAAVARHDAILRAAIEAEGGCVFRRMGDGVCASFPTAPSAVSAALAAQRALHAERWEESGPIRARMALHTGVGDVRDGDYAGAHLNRIARLLAAGHGCQTLLSQATYDLVRDGLPVGINVRDLGEHRLRDLQRPEHVYQLVAQDLPNDFPPLQSLDALPNNLPIQLTSFIGRERELAEIRRLLGEHRLVTLTGAGGCGKTRLALQVAADALERFTDGVWLVELAQLANSELVPQAVASALGVREEPDRPLLTTLAEHLRPKHVLLVLDNCEHLIAACARLTDTLLRACSRLTILASSREALGIAGETAFRVPSLGLPEAGQTQSVTQVAACEAVRLLVERATTVQPAFALTEQNAAVVAQVCRRLDGIPLALELAAARVRALTVEQVAQRLDDRFRLLTGGSRTALPRQQTLRALIDWSYDLLSKPERIVLRWLSVFVGGWTLEAAEAVCSGDSVDRDEVLDLLTRLVDKSLVLVDEQQRAVRYRLLETVRQYTREKLLEAGEAEAVRDRHLHWYLDQVEAALSHQWNPRQFETRMAAEFDNLRAALEWSRNKASGETELRLAGAMLGSWAMRGSHSEGRAAIAHALARSDPTARTKARARALFAAGQLAGMQTDVGSASAQVEESVAIYRELGEKREFAFALLSLGRIVLQRGDEAAARSIQAEMTALFRETGERWGLALSLFLWGDGLLDAGEHAEARDRLAESLILFQELGDRQQITNPMLSLARVACAEGDYVKGHALAEESLTIRREQDDNWRVAIALVSLGEVERCVGNDQQAKARFEEALALYEAVGDPNGVAWALHNLGHVALRAGDSRRAATLFAEGLTIRMQHDYKAGVAAGLAGMAGVTLRLGQPERTARLFGAVEALLASIHAVLAPADKLAYDRDVAALRAQLDEPAFEAAWAEGRGLTLEQAIQEALDGSLMAD